MKIGEEERKGGEQVTGRKQVMKRGRGEEIEREENEWRREGRNRGKRRT